jgi:multidrug efflux system outer membrane protein
MSLRRFLMPGLMSLLAAGCATHEMPAPPRIDVPTAFRETDPRWTRLSPQDAAPRGAWWTIFADPTLDRLVEQGLAANTGIAQAAARLAQSRAVAATAQANRMPTLGASGGVSRQGGPLINAAGADGTLMQAAAQAGWEIDLIGRLSRTAGAAELDARSREAALESTRLMVAADIAAHYFSLRGIDDEAAVVRATQKAQQDSLALTESRQRSGLSTELDVVRVRGEIATLEADAAALARRRADLEHALALLLGQPASTFQQGAINARSALPVVPPGIPSTVLARRPDVSAAERGMAAARTRLGVAHDAWFPNLNLTASGGYASSELGSLFSIASRAWGIGALLSLPIFDGGRREAGIRNAQAELELNVAAYREQVLVAFKDVEDQLAALRHLADQAEATRVAAAAGTRAAELARSRHANGLVSQLEVLGAERGALKARRAAQAIEAQRFASTVALIRALGGGWGDAPTVGRTGNDVSVAARPAPQVQ